MNSPHSDGAAACARKFCGCMLGLSANPALAHCPAESFAFRSYASRAAAHCRIRCSTPGTMSCDSARHARCRTLVPGLTVTSSIEHHCRTAGRPSTRTCGLAASIVSSRGTATAASSSPRARWRSCWRSCRSCCCWPSPSSAPRQSRCADGVDPAGQLSSGFTHQ